MGAATGGRITEKRTLREAITLVGTMGITCYTTGSLRIRAPLVDQERGCIVVECCVSCTAICGGWSLHCHSLVGGASIHQPNLVGGAWGLTCQGTVGWTMGDELARLCPRSAGYAALHVSTHVCHSRYMPSDFPCLSMALILKKQLK